MALRQTIAVLSLAGVLSLGACAPAEDDAKIRSEIEAASTAWETAFNAGDATGVAALYTEDGMVMAPDMEPIMGREAQAAFWRAAMDGGLTTIDLVTEEVYAGRGVATEVGRAVFFDAEGNSPGSSKYIVIWKKTDEGWRGHRDIWNENQPMMVAPEPEPNDDDSGMGE